MVENVGLPVDSPSPNASTLDNQQQLAGSSQFSLQQLLKTSSSNGSPTHNSPPSAGLLRESAAIDPEMQSIIQSVRDAISQGIYPQRIAKGSSGSYFCRNPNGEIVGVFKPKNEEPYGHLNPKWTKWLHKTCFPCCFGRSCLMPNTGYISEAAAYVVDRMLDLHVVPNTYVIHLASPSFFYSRKDRVAAASSGGVYPPKIGSFQKFMKGYMDASQFLREGPDMMRDGRLPIDQTTGALPAGMQAMFQDQFERLVILDFIIRNTDRGLDNWMVRFDADERRDSSYVPTKSRSTSVSGVKSRNTDVNTLHSTDAVRSASHSLMRTTVDDNNLGAVLRTEDTDNMDAVSGNSENYDEFDMNDLVIIDSPRLFIAAIDNGLAFPFKHPDKWRSYPYGWSYLPAARVSFSQRTRDNLLPKLSSAEWWFQLISMLRQVCSLDSEFDGKLFRRQLAVMRGQVYNLVQVLSSRDAHNGGTSPSPAASPSRESTDPSSQLLSLPGGGSPVDLIAMPPCLVWDDSDVRDLGHVFRDGVLGTIIGGIEALKSGGGHHRRLSSTGPHGGGIGGGISYFNDQATISPISAGKQPASPTTSENRNYNERKHSQKGTFDGTKVVPLTHKPDEQRRRVEETIEEGREELPENVGSFLASNAPSNQPSLGRGRRYHHGGRFDAFRGRIITFVKSQPWFRSW